MVGAALAVVLVVGGCSDSGSDDDAVRTETSAADASTATSADAATDDSTGDATASTGPVVATGAPVPSAGCGSSETGAVTKERRTLDVEGAERWYLLTTPADHDGHTPLPLVLDFHGLAEGAEIHSNMTAYSELAQAEGFVVAFPNGTGEPVAWNPTTNESNADLAFTSTLLDTLGADLCLDTSRVYATGLSNGAMMSSAVGCGLSDRFAAIAPVSGILDRDPCDQSRPVPVLAMHGTADPILGFNGGVGEIAGILDDGDPTNDDAPTTTAVADLEGPGYPEAVAAWAERNGCDPEPTDVTQPDATDEIVHRTYDCPEGADVEFMIIVGGGHSWPGSELSVSLVDIMGHTTLDLDATAATWAFFQRFQLP